MTPHPKTILLHFVAFFNVTSLFSTGVDNEKVGVDNEKALELDSRTFFRIFQPDFNIENRPKMQQNILLHNGMIWFKLDFLLPIPHGFKNFQFRILDICLNALDNSLPWGR